MSTILDSLKKSSDKRDDKNKNSIDNFSFSSGNSTRKSKFPVVLILLLLTAAILYFGYQYLYSDEKSDIDFSNQSELVKSKGVNPETKNNDLVVVDSSTKIQKQDKPNSKDVKQRINEIKERRKQQQASDTASTTVVAESPEAIVVNNVDVKQTENQKEPDLRLSMPGEIANQPQPVEKAEQEFPYVYQLPFSLRKDIPKLKLNIHVYDKDPESRIAIINGVRFVIDDMIDDIVLVKDIVPEGVLLEFNSRVFLIPK